MEHRYCPRIKGSMLFTIYQDNQPLGPFPSRNLSLDGLFLETGDLGLNSHSPIRICFQSGRSIHCMAGHIMHCNAQGMGVMLINRNPHYIQAMLDIIDRESTPSWMLRQVRESVDESLVTCQYR